MKYRTEIHDELVKWYKVVKRDLPWRKTQDPYKIWISEVMLQQTLVETVKGYYERFLKAFPTVEDLAKSDDEKLMKLWEGLGYYSRARNLKRAAIMIMEDFDGIMPNDLKSIRKLPGIGPYTAGAILSIAYDKPVAAVDGNVIRVYSRLFKIEQAVDLKDVKAEIERIADEMVHETDPSSYNQSLMELGATICIPKNPRCLTCPVQAYCEAFKAGVQNELPKKSPKKAKKEVDLYAMIIRKEDSFLILKRPSDGLLPGLWSVPSVELSGDEKKTASPVDRCQQMLLEEIGIDAVFKKEPGIASHVFTHIKWSIKALEFEWTSGNLPDYPETKWIKVSQVDNFAFPTAYKKALRLGSLI
ncbi:A/G-specific adenine glycosylase [Fusibacter sp. JL216-2]|uniref:A/G-specific adenine glycosylase n=1 Tax=Fusibacter sp. JL216-2 TaxID=3071453 RepID=UPI003D32ED57